MNVYDTLAAMETVRRAYQAAIRRKAQETTRKEETMPTLLEDLNKIWDRVTKAPSISEAEAYKRLRAHIEANQPWLPPQQEGFGPWIEYRVGDPGPRVTDTVCLLLRKMRELRLAPTGLTPGSAREFVWDGNAPNPIVAYCVKLEAKTDE